MSLSNANRLYSLLVATLYLTIIEDTAKAQEAPPPLEQRLEQIQRMASGTLGGYEKVFDPSFLKLVPAAKLEPILADYFQKG